MVTAAALVVAAVAASFAVQIIESIWLPLAVIGTTGFILVAAVSWYRRNDRGW